MARSQVVPAASLSTRAFCTSITIYCFCYRQPVYRLLYDVLRTVRLTRQCDCICSNTSMPCLACWSPPLKSGGQHGRIAHRPPIPRPPGSDGPCQEVVANATACDRFMRQSAGIDKAGRPVKGSPLLLLLHGTIISLYSVHKCAVFSAIVRNASCLICQHHRT